MSRVFHGGRVLMQATKSAVTVVEKIKKLPTGIMKELPVSPPMKSFVGVPQISRPQAVKKIWEYIKKHNLQNPANKREIKCDEKLKTIFSGKDTVGILEIGGLMKPHFLKAN